MEKEYKKSNLIEMSSIIEDAAYAVQNCDEVRTHYTVGNSKSGSSSCASQSKCGNSKASSIRTIDNKI